MMIFSHKGLAARKLSSAVTDFPHQIYGEQQRKYSGWADGDTPKLSWFIMVYQYLISLISLIISVMLSIVIIFPVYDSLWDPAFFLLRKHFRGDLGDQTAPYLEGSRIGSI